MKEKYSIFWFRRDLRLMDNAGLYHSLKSTNKVIPIFIFDKIILDDLITKRGKLELDKRIIFIQKAIQQISSDLKKINSDLWVFYGKPLEIFYTLKNEINIDKVFTNHDYEPYAIQRDYEIKQLLNKDSIEFLTFKDQCIFEKREILKPDTEPYTVFTPYSKKWKEKLSPFFYKSFQTEKYFNNFSKLKFPTNIPTLKEMGFLEEKVDFPNSNLNNELIDNYAQNRNFPSRAGTSKIGVHLRFGTVSIRKLVAQAVMSSDEAFLNELIWRDFYMMILSNFPHVVHKSFKSAYDSINWKNDINDFELWCKGLTGFPIVDAGMRELNSTGFMHNRVRMIVASFLTKHLLIDWRWGEAYFAKKLLDFELSSNNGGWQWAAGCGCDAAPYFRIFNPSLQTIKFDSDLIYIKKWIPELDSLEYPLPMVNHDFARKRCLETFKKALNN